MLKNKLILILFLAALVRLLFLARIPNGFFLDEASNGYDAYSLLHTGRDHYGNYAPLFLRALDDYREALYIYFMIPFVKIFGLNEFAVRLPSAFIGIITVAIIYFLAKEIFGSRVALVAALFLALNPWHIHYSRIAFRAILLPCLFSLALLFFIKSFQKPKYLIVSGFVFALSAYTYSSARFFVPFFLVCLCVRFWQHLWKQKEKSLIALIVFLPLFIPIFLFWLSPEGMSRAQQIGGFETNPIKLITNYLSYFDPSFLFFNGTKNPRLNAPHLSQLYDFELLTVIIGLIYIFKGKINPQNRDIILLWLLTYPLPAAFLEPSHSIRAIVGSALFPIISASGAIQLIDLFSLTHRPKILRFVACIFFVIALTILVQLYFIDYPLKITKSWQYGYREAIRYAEEGNYNCVVMKRQDNQGEWLFESQSFSVFVPFYTQYPPKEYQDLPTHPWKQQPKNLDTSIWQKPIYSIGKYTLMPISQETKLGQQCLLIIPMQGGESQEKNDRWKLVYTVKDARNNEHFKLYEASSN